jgi:hypothetical protein
MRIGHNVNNSLQAEDFVYADRIIVEENGKVGFEAGFYKKCKARDFKNGERRQEMIDNAGEATKDVQAEKAFQNSREEVTEAFDGRNVDERGFPVE